MSTPIIIMQVQKKVLERVSLDVPKESMSSPIDTLAPKRLLVI